MMKYQDSGLRTTLSDRAHAFWISHERDGRLLHFVRLHPAE